MKPIQNIFYFILLGACMLLLPMVASAKKPIKELTSLTEILQIPNPWNRIKGLEEWKQKPTQNEFAILSELVETNDWMLHHTATKILRRWGQITNTTLPEVESAEKIFEKMWYGKISNDRYDKLIPELVLLGNNIVPLLIDMLEYNLYYDRLRKRIAIKTLSQLKDKRIVPGLKKVIAQEKHNSNNFIAQELYALLTYDSSDEMVEYVANIIASKAYQQNQIIVYLTRQDLPKKMKICSYYKTYNRSGKYGVIKSLGNIDDKEAFEMLSLIILEFPDRNGNFTYATRVLGEMRSGDACPLFLDLVKKSPARNSDNMICTLGKKRYQPAIPTLEKIIANTEKKRSKILAAGALCRLGVNYDKHAAIVREGLDKEMQSYTAYRVVGWLNDDKTAKSVAAQLGSTKPEERTGALAIEALGKMGNDCVLTELKNSLVKVSVQNFEDVGKVIIAIGQSNNNEAIISDGQEIENLGKYLQRIKMSCQKVQIGINPKLKQKLKQNKIEKEQGAKWLKEHPEVWDNILSQFKTDKSLDGFEILRLLPLLEISWDERTIPYLKQIIATNTTRVSHHKGDNIIPHYHVRSRIAAFLIKKTGKEHTYIDVDGSEKTGGSSP